MIHWLWVWGPAIAQMAAIFALSNTSDIPDLPGGLSNYTGHFIGYGALGVLALRGFAKATWRGVSRGAAWKAIAFAAAYGLTDEFHQSFVAKRTPSLEDWAFDIAGASVAVLIVVWLRRFRRP